MQSDPASSPAVTPASPEPSAGPSSRQGTNLLILGVPMLCVAITAAFWWQTRSELSAMRSTQQELLEVLDAVRGASTIDVSGDPALGAEDAVVTLVEFSDYECPFCIRHFSQTMGEIDEKFIRTGRIQYVFKDFPIAQLHPDAILAHQATRCAAEQGKFWEMHSRMFSPAGTHSPEQLEAHAKAAGVSIEPYLECLASNRTLTDVKASVDTAVQLGANGTPAFFVGIRDLETNHVRILQGLSGAQPFAEFEKVIQTVEARVRR